MSQVYASILKPVIANAFLLVSFDLSVFQNMHCDEKSSMFIYLFIYLLVYLFIWLILFNQFLARSITFSVVDAEWLNALRRFPIS